MAHEIIESNPELSRIALIGIPSRGIEIAQRLAGYIRQFENAEIETGVVDVAMHRDDLRTRKQSFPRGTHASAHELADKTLILTDDVLFSGRTCRAAMDSISSFGRPARIQYAVLIDRGHRELPIRADYVGKNLPTAYAQRVHVRFQNTDGVPDSVWTRKSERKAPMSSRSPNPSKVQLREETPWTRKDLCAIQDLSPEEITMILDTAAAFKTVGTREIKKVPALRGKTMVNFFVEPSTRTRMSFELAAYPAERRRRSICPPRPRA